MQRCLVGQRTLQERVPTQHFCMQVRERGQRRLSEMPAQADLVAGRKLGASQSEPILDGCRVSGRHLTRVNLAGDSTPALPSHRDIDAVDERFCGAQLWLSRPEITRPGRSGVTLPVPSMKGSRPGG